MGAQADPSSKSAWQIFQNSVRRDGVLSLWRGVVPSTQRAALLTAGQMSTYDQIKHFFIDRLHFPDTSPTHFLSSACAGIITTTITSPHDVIKTRLMNQKTMMYSSTLDCFAKTIKNEGVRALFKGWVPNYVRLGPQTFIILNVTEQLRRLVGLGSV
eukprot:TRINITY_DN8361_c0_g1_i1.p1 TRINITY_DN8361_c0_g1~~TRINITY_DN8361_c0_g1_i1.p1  ORF type:complete len:165 (+),score=17.03 TRINITY_DN8361_c0_g1_i1:26-496(+)